MTRRIGRLLLAGTVFLAQASAARAEAEVGDIGDLIQLSQTAGPIVTRAPAFTEDDQMLFAVTSGQLQLSDGFEGYSSRAGVFLPIGALARLIDINIDVDPQRQRATGWVVTPQRTLLVDLPNRRMEVAGVETKLSEADAVFKDGDLYLRTQIIEKLLPVRLTADMAGLNLDIKPTEKLPFQERLERELRSNLLGGVHDEGEAKLVATPYRLFTPPSVDINLNLGAGNHTPKSTGAYDARLAGDLFGSGLQVYVGSDSDFNMATARVLLTRKDPFGKIAGPFGATRSALGDTYTPTMSIGARSTAGRGIALTSMPLEQASVFDKTDLRGELPLGYQVELYVNEVLRGAQATPVQGRYEFTGVNLAYGLNVIRLVFYGPRGERREDVRRINVGGGALAKGQTTYNFGAVQEGLTVLDVGEEVVGAPGQGEWRVTGQIAHGLTDMTTLVAAYGRYTPRIDDPRQVGSLGLLSSIAGAAVQFDTAFDDQGGSALAVGAAGRFGPTSVVGRHSEYAGGFIDEMQSGGAAALKRNTTLGIDTLLQVFGAQTPASFRLTFDQYDLGLARFRADARLSKAVGRYLVSTGLQYDRLSGAPTGAVDQLNGGVDVSALVDGHWQLRAGALYTIAPDLKVTSAGITADRNFGDRNAVHLGVTHSFDPDDTVFSVGETWRLDPADISLVAAYTTGAKDFRLGLNLSLGFGYDPWRGRYAALGPGAASGGAMAVDAFLDDNGNGLHDPGEKPLEGIKIQGGRQPEITDKNGHALVTGLGDGAFGQTSLDISSLDDPYLEPLAPSVKIVPRPGRIAQVAYPVTISGEVELHAVFQRPGENARGISALHIELVGADGKVAAVGSSEFDGTIIIEKVKPGTYQVRIEKAQADRLKMVLLKPVSITINPGGGFAGRFDLQVTTRDPAAGGAK